MEMEAETDKNFSDKGTSTGIRDCFVRLGLASPILEIERQLSELTKENFPLIDPDDGQQTCVVCAKSFQSRPPSPDDEAEINLHNYWQRKLKAFRMFCLLILNNSSDLDSINNPDEINFGGGRSFQCCEGCCSDLEILETTYAEMCKKMEEVENSSAQIMRVFLNVFMQKIFKPSPVLRSHLRQEEEPILLKRWRNHLICRLVVKNSDRSCQNKKVKIEVVANSANSPSKNRTSRKRATANRPIRRRQENRARNWSPEPESKSPDSGHSGGNCNLDPQPSAWESLQIEIKEEEENQADTSKTVYACEFEQDDLDMEADSLIEEAGADSDFEAHEYASGSSDSDHALKKRKRTTRTKFSVNPRGRVQKMRKSSRIKVPSSLPLKKKWDTSGTGPEYIHNCNECGRAWKSAAALKGHMAVHQDKEFRDSNVAVFNDKIIRKQTIGNYSFFVCEICGQKFSTKDLFQFHMKYHLDKKTFPCPTCGKKMKSEMLLGKHIKYNHNAPLCRFCGKKVPGIALYLRKHELTHHREEYLSDNPFYCTICLLTFETQNEVDSHVAVHESSKCKICGYVCQHARGLLVHERRHYITYKTDLTKEGSTKQEEDGRSVLCLLCHSKFENDDLARAHYQEQHKSVNNKAYGHRSSFNGLSVDAINPRKVRGHSLTALMLCAYGCSSEVHKGGYSIEKLREHYITHHKEVYLIEKPFWCKICFQTFETEEQKNEHESSENSHRYIFKGEKTGGDTTSTLKIHACDTCGKTFEKEGNYERHKERFPGPHKNPTTISRIRNVSERLKVNCEYCGKRMCSGRTMRLHLLNEHREEYLRGSPYCCKICIRAYPTQAELDGHYELASGCHYKCKFCPSMFQSNYKLQEHERTHTGEKPYVCEVCGKGFATDPGLRSHKKTHTGEKSIWCTICPERTVGFTRNREHQKHMQRRHPNEYISGGGIRSRSRNARKSSFIQSDDIFITP